MTGLFHTLLTIVFVISSVLLIIVILLQEPKGGGLAEAFGGAGAETFGVRERGINKFTASVAAVFLASAVSLHLLGGGTGESAFKEQPAPPSVPGQAPGGGGAGAAGGTTGQPPGGEQPPPDKPK